MANTLRKTGHADILANRKSMGRHGAKARALKKKSKGALERGATGTLDHKAAEKRIRETGSVL